jgi:DNA-directed RNA polymerase subunit beta'
MKENSFDFNLYKWNPNNSDTLEKIGSIDKIEKDGEFSQKKVSKKNLYRGYGFRNIKFGHLILNINNQYILLEYLNPLHEYSFPLSSKILLEPGNFVDIGEPITEGIVDLHELLHILFKYHSIYDGIMKGTFRSLTKFQLLLVNSIQSIYQSQGVNISSKHIEIIVRQMTAKVFIKESGDTPLLPGELIRLSLISQIYESLKLSESKLSYRTPTFEPLLLSATNSSLSKDGFLSAAGFQETKRVLTKAAIEGSSDWLRGLKECIIIGRLIPAGSTFLNYKNYLDNVYLFKS